MEKDKDFEKNLLLKPVDLIKPLGINTYIARIYEESIHMHDSIEFIYVLWGEANIKVSYRNYHLVKGDFFLLNFHEIHKIASEEGVEILFLHIDSAKFEENMFVFDIEFYRRFNQREIDEIKKLMVSIYGATLAVGRMDNYKVKELISMVLEICIKNFPMHFYDWGRERKKEYSSNVNEQRMMEMILIFYNNFDKKLKLTDLAKRFNIDSAYASRLIKQEMGMTFQESLNFIRIDRSELYILGTREPIQNITDLLGFSSYKYFAGNFKKIFGLSPGAYRKKFKPFCYLNYEERLEIKKYTESMINKQTSEKSLQSKLETILQVVKNRADEFNQHMSEISDLEAVDISEEFIKITIKR